MLSPQITEVGDCGFTIPEPSGVSSGTYPLDAESRSYPKIPIDHSQFKDGVGRYRTVSLFYELNDDRKYPSFFTLKERDWKGHTSLRKMYLEMEDLSEYAFAAKAFGSWDHWRKLVENYWFKPILSEWRIELRTRLKSKQLQKLTELSKRNDATGLAATRALLEEVSPKSKRGRPSKEEVAAERKRAVASYGDTEADALRLGIVVPITRLSPEEPTIGEANSHGS